jgi:hypothetical protein
MVVVTVTTNDLRCISDAFESIPDGTSIDDVPSIVEAYITMSLPRANPEVIRFAVTLATCFQKSGRR